MTTHTMLTYVWSAIGILMTGWISKRTTKRLNEGELGLLTCWGKAVLRKTVVDGRTMLLPVAKYPGWIFIWPWQNVKKHEAFGCFTTPDMFDSRMENNRAVKVSVMMTYNILILPHGPLPECFDITNFGLFRTLFRQDNFKLQTQINFEAMIAKKLEKIAYGTPSETLEREFLSAAKAMFSPIGIDVREVSLRSLIETFAFQWATAHHTGPAIPLPADGDVSVFELGAPSPDAAVIHLVPPQPASESGS